MQTNINEQLSKYKNDIPQDPEGAALDLMDLINKFIPLVEKALQRAGAFIAPTLYSDFKDELLSKLKEVKLPDVSKLENIMQQVGDAEKELKTKQEKKEEKSEKTVAPAKKEEKQPKEAPPEEKEEEIVFP